jgi:hypothetical protein
MNKHSEYGASWKRIAAFFPTRTDINIKSRWQLIQRRLRKETPPDFERQRCKQTIMTSEPLPNAFSRRLLRQERPPPPPNSEGAHEANEDVWGSILMNGENEMGRIFDYWF